MSLKKFITDILNIPPEKIESISSIDSPDDSLTLKIKLIPENDLLCPYCQKNVKIHGYSQRKLIHSTLVNRKCTIFYSQRRYRCDICDFTFSENNPFINSSENGTLETKINVLKDLKHVTSTYTSVAERYSLSITKVQRIFDKHVQIERKTLPRILSIDEHYFPELDYDSLYCCLLMDFNDGTLIDVLPDRKKEYLISYFSKIKNMTLDHKTGKSELNNVEYISIDLWEPYKSVAQTYFPKAIICADSFHVIKNLTKLFRDIRLRVRRNTEDENIKYLLSKFSFIFNHGINLDNNPKFNKRFNRYMNYRDMQEMIFNLFPELKKAYELKESYIIFNKTSTLDNAKEGLAEQIKAFGESNIKEYIEFYNLLINWNQEIINSFTIIDNKRINNSHIESRNNKLERLLFNANGFKNFKRTRNRILYCLNEKDTYKL